MEKALVSEEVHSTSSDLGLFFRSAKSEGSSEVPVPVSERRSEINMFPQP